jgi:hypothetical protein
MKERKQEKNGKMKGKKGLEEQKEKDKKKMGKKVMVVIRK